MKTKNGHEVIVHDFNGEGSFPIKGTIMRLPPKQRKPLRYQIWRADGRCYPLKPSGWDLIMEEQDNETT